MNSVTLSVMILTGRLGRQVPNPRKKCLPKKASQAHRQVSEDYLAAPEASLGLGSAPNPYCLAYNQELLNRAKSLKREPSVAKEFAARSELLSGGKRVAIPAVRRERTLGRRE